MNQIIRYEVERLRTVPSYWLIFTVVCLAQLVGPSLGTEPGLGSYNKASTIWTAFHVVLFWGTLAMAVVGVMAFGHEYRYNTIQTSLFGSKSFLALFTAKTTVAICYATVFALASVGLIIVTSLLVWNNIFGEAFGSFPFDFGMWFVISGVITACVFHAVLGVIVGSLIKSYASAMATVICWIVLVEPWLGSLGRASNWSWTHYLPHSAIAVITTYPSFKIEDSGQPSTVLSYVSLVALLVLGFVVVSLRESRTQHFRRRLISGNKR